MTRRTAHGIAGLCLLVGVVLGAVPVAQWFLFGHTNGLVARLLGAPTEPLVWAVPLAVAVACAAGVLYFGVRGDRAD